MTTPVLPPRPVRSQNAPTSSLKVDNSVPVIPPRPKRTVDRSISPRRDSFARSPLNDPTFIPKGKSNGVSNGAYNHGNQSDSNLPRRPPSVSLPSIGQEGTEYASLESYSSDQEAPEQTSNVAGDLPLHAPKASLPASSAKSRIQTVTRTDSSQAAAAGIGKANSETEVKVTGPASSTGTPSIHTKEDEDQEQGIPEIGLQIPLYPNAGDVQAPTPSPSHLGQTAKAAPNKGSPAARHHSRTKSGREIFRGPPGSYGMHGHGSVSTDPLEKAWYHKHPDVLAREVKGEYGPAIQENRKEYMLSSEELNKLVHQSGSNGIGMGTFGSTIVLQLRLCN